MKTSQTLKLSDVLSLDGDFYRGVILDTESFSPPPKLKCIGFIYTETPDGELDERLIDTLIAYSIAGVEVILEIPAEEPLPEPSYIMAIASNAGFSISLLPPVTETEASSRAYVERIGEFMSAYLKQKNFSRYIYPLSSFVEYLFAEHYCGGKVAHKELDPYVQQAFASVMSSELEKAIKDEMRDRIYAAYGGKGGFHQLAMGMIKCVSDEVKRMATSMREPEVQAA